MAASDEECLRENLPLLSDNNDDGGTNNNSDKEERDARKRLHVIRHGAEREIRLLIVVEEWRLAFYLAYTFLFFVGFTLTSVFVKGDFAKILRDVFGVVNVCVYLDFPPSTYVMPSLWSLALLFMHGYVVASLFRAWVAKEEGKISHTSFVAYSILLAYVVLSFIFFSTVFAVQPSIHDPNSVKIHTIPYLNWTIAMFVLYVLIAWFGEKVAWTNMGLHPCLIYFNRVMVGIQAITTIGGIINMINALADQRNGLWWKPSESPSMVMVFQVSSYLWVLTVLWWPPILSAFLIRKGHQSHCVYVSLQDNRESKL